MALFSSQDQEMSIVLRLRDEATKGLQAAGKNVEGFKTKLESMQPTFQKMRNYGALAFGALSAGAVFAVQEAATAEGAYNKFNTVFGEHSGDMLSFVHELRKSMPTATHEIVRMAADMQDLLVPMGLSRGLATEMSQGFLDVANKVAAFNDVDPTEVLEAIKSGLAGASQPLRRFGVNAQESALEARALSMGLLEAGQSFSDLDPEVKMAVRAQALLAQVIENSSDAINGFAENNDSFIRRQQELRASLQETRAELGNALLPIMDRVLKAILPVVAKIAEWTEKNPKLVLAVIGVVGALSGLALIIGTIGLALPGLITLVSALGAGLMFVAANPIGLLVVALGALVVWFLKVSSEIGGVRKTLELMGEAMLGWLRSAAEPFVKMWEKISTGISRAIDTVKSFARALRDLPGGISNKVGNLLGFEHGGIVPGPIGKAVPIMAHGGERIIPASQSKGGDGATFNVTINNPVVRNDGDVRAIREQIDRALRDVVRVHKVAS